MCEGFANYMMEKLVAQVIVDLNLAFRCNFTSFLGLQIRLCLTFMPDLPILVIHFKYFFL